ncbi:Glycosyl hydrolases family 43 [Abditibacterium utsteinense]|uniref:Glycosyl hydrolases family 43 n=1 Tax=Abditibacterium utsteinense TaxID=1960156 RepID=A0A2S8SR88_9BACT|nr:family 43 glycosylhydrolase [Abditibacterium utsteinense]PQV63332.1 Glycosyl hydrolases family 43 [Abditibacterium utsteinense]
MSSISPPNFHGPGNPVIPLYAADPHAELLGDRYYIYATHAGIYSSAKAFHEKAEGENHGFAAWSSPDLCRWKSEGAILRFSEIPWARELGDAWAPCIAERNGRFYFYFCAGSRIGVAVGDSPIGPFHDALGEPLVPFRADMSAIDPMVFIDDDGQAYFYWGAVPGAWLESTGIEIRMHLSVRQLNADMISFASEESPTIATEKSPAGWHSLDHIEASHVFKREGIYYLMWSPGGFESNDDARAYRVHYATSSSPLGPWKQAANNPVLTSRREVGVVGPGHHSTIQIPGTDEWFCVYHCHKGDADRRTFIDRMSFAADGSIETIVPTLEGPPSHPIRLALSATQKGPYRAGEMIRLQAQLIGETKTQTQQQAPQQRIQFFSGTEKIGESSENSTQFEWREASLGFHRLSARAFLSCGKIVTSGPINIDVLR